MVSFRFVILLLFLQGYAFGQSKIIYSSAKGALNSGGTLDVMMYDPALETHRLLYKGSVSGRGEYHAVLSSDNSKILFNTYQFGGWKLGIGDFNGTTVSNVKKFSNRRHYAYCGNFSPDGSRIVFQEYDWGKNAATIYVTDMNRSYFTSIISPNISDQSIDWTRDSKGLVFTYAKDNSLSIYKVSATGTGLQRLSADTANDFAVSTSKVSDQIAFLSDATGHINLFVMDTDGKNLKNLTPNLKPADADINSIWAYRTSWSPDGKFIVFNAMVGGNLELFVVANDGSGLTQITKNSATDMTPFWTNSF